MRALDHPYFTDGLVALAHRGGSEYAPNRGKENTMLAFGNAVQLGYRYLETDVHASADGELFAFHDEALDRVTDAQGLIAQVPGSVVRAARIDGSEPIPSLDEILETWPEVRVNIDVKSEQAVEPLVACLRRHQALDRVCVGSFSDARLTAVRKALGPGLATSAGPRRTAEAVLAPGVVWSRLRGPELAFQVPVTHPLAGRPVRIVTPRFVQRVHALGKQVHVWTIDDAATMNELFDMGVDGIVTDRIDTLAQVLADRGQALN